MRQPLLKQVKRKFLQLRNDNSRQHEGVLLSRRHIKSHDNRSQLNDARELALLVDRRALPQVSNMSLHQQIKKKTKLYPMHKRDVLECTGIHSITSTLPADGTFRTYTRHINCFFFPSHVICTVVFRIVPQLHRCLLRLNCTPPQTLRTFPSQLPPACSATPLELEGSHASFLLHQHPHPPSIAAGELGELQERQACGSGAARRFVCLASFVTWLASRHASRL